MDSRRILFFLSLIYCSYSYAAEYNHQTGVRITRRESKRRAIVIDETVAKMKWQKQKRRPKKATQILLNEIKAVEEVFAPRRAQDLKRGKREQEQIERESLELASLVPPANSSIILYNANVPLESLTLTECEHIERKGKPESPNKGIWNIPFDINNEPYGLSVEANGKKYIWYIPSIAINSGTEFCLIQEKISKSSDDVELTLMQCGGETGEYEYLIQQIRESSIERNFLYSWWQASTRCCTIL